ncbi:MAG: hypothetical protein ACTSRS_16585 [Candidatus Helarchaeota archaeon]
MCINLIFDTDTFILLKRGRLLSLIFNHFQISASEALKIEIVGNLNAREKNKYADKIRLMEFDRKDEQFKRKIIKKFLGKDILTNYERGRHIKHEGEIDGICLSRYKNTIFISEDKNAHFIAKNLNIKIYILEDLIFRLEESFQNTNFNKMKQILTTFYFY